MHFNIKSQCLRFSLTSTNLITIKSSLSFFLIFFFLLNTNSLAAQDLIERTQQGIQADAPKKVNEIAKFVAKKWKRSNSRDGDLQLFDFHQQEDQIDADVVVREAVYLDIRPTEVSNLLREHPEQLSISIPVNAKSAVALDLVEVDVTSSDFDIVLSSGNEPPSLKDAIFYRGIVRGNTDSWAAISVFEDQIMGVIADEYGNYVLGDIENSAQYTFFNDHNFVENFAFDCSFVEGNLSESNGFGTKSEESSGRQAATNCVKIYFETDFHSYGNLGSNATSVMNYVMGAFNALKTIYQNEQIMIEMSDLKIWDTPDQYGGTKGASCSPVMSNFWNAVGPTLNGDLAHLITAIDPTGGYSVCGLAALSCSCSSSSPSVCNKPAFCTSARSVGVSQTLNTYQNFPTYSWTVNVLAHEIGHNFGSPHTQACAWNGNNTAIDGCVPAEPQSVYGDRCNRTTATCTTPAIENPGTIMSYCHQRYAVDLNKGFGTQPGNLIRSNYMNASCLTACSESPGTGLGDGVCRSSIVVTDSDIGPTGIFRSASTVETNGSTITISNGETANFIATTSITLRAGFTAAAGSRFTGRIESCTVSALQTDDVNINTYLAGIVTDQQLEDLSTDDFVIVPNPATSQVSFTFELAKDSEVSIQIYDLSGQLVEVVIDRQLIRKGYNQVDHQLHSLREGMFYTVLNIAGELRTKKMILVK